MKPAGRKGEYWENPKRLATYLYELGANIHQVDNINFKWTPISLSVALDILETTVSSTLKRMAKVGENNYCDSSSISVDRYVGPQPRRQRLIYLLNNEGLSKAKELLDQLRGETIRYVRNGDTFENTIEEILELLKSELKEQNRFFAYSLLSKHLEEEDPVTWNELISSIPYEHDLLYSFKIDGNNISLREYLSFSSTFRKDLFELYHVKAPLGKNEFDSFISLNLVIDDKEEGFHGGGSDKLNYEIIEQKAHRDTSCIIKGGAGSGKTAILRRISMKMLQNNSTRKLPIYLPLKKFDHESVEDFIESMLSENYSDEIIIANYKAFRDHGQICYLFDGFDELGENAIKFRNSYKIFAEKFIVSNSNNAIITTRDDLKIPSIGNYLHVDNLDDNQRDQFLRSIFYGEKGKYKTLNNRIIKDPYLNTATKNPLILTIVSLLYRNEAIDTIEKISRVDIYEEFTTELLQRRIAKEENEEGFLSQPSLRKITEKIAFDMTNNEIVEIKKDQLLSIITGNFPEITDQEKALDELSRKIGILQGDNSFSFIHKSFQEFLTSKYISRRMEDPISYLSDEKILTKIDLWLPIIDFFFDRKPCNNLIRRINENEEDLLFTKLHLMSHLMVTCEIEQSIKDRIIQYFIENYYDLSLTVKRKSNLLSIQEIARIVIKESSSPDLVVKDLFSKIPISFWKDLNRNIWYKFLYGMPLELVLMAIDSGYENAKEDFTMRVAVSYQHNNNQIRESTISSINQMIVKMIEDSYKKIDDNIFTKLLWSSFSCSIYNKDLEDKLVGLIFSLIEEEDFSPGNIQDQYIITRILLPLFRRDHRMEVSTEIKVKLMNFINSDDVEISLKSSIARILRFSGDQLMDYKISQIKIPDHYLSEVLDLQFLLWGIKKIRNPEDRQLIISYLLDKRKNPLLKLKDREVIIPIVEYINDNIQDEKDVVIRNLLIGLLESFDNLIIFDYLLRLFEKYKDVPNWKSEPDYTLNISPYEAPFLSFGEYDKVTSIQFVASKLVSAKGIHLIQKQKELAMTFTENDDSSIRAKAFDILFYGESKKRKSLITRLLETDTPFRCQIINQKQKCVSSSYYPYPMKYNLHIGEPHDNLEELIDYLVELYNDNMNELGDRICDICIMVPDDRTIFALQNYIDKEVSQDSVNKVLNYLYFYLKRNGKMNDHLKSRIIQYIGHLVETGILIGEHKSKDTLEALFEVSKYLKYTLDLIHVYQISLSINKESDIKDIIQNVYSKREITSFVKYLQKNIDEYSIEEIQKGLDIINIIDGNGKWLNNKGFIKKFDNYMNDKFSQINEFHEIYGNKNLWAIDLDYIEDRFRREKDRNIKFILFVPLWYRANKKKRKEIINLIMDEWDPSYSYIIHFNYPDLPYSDKLSNDSDYNNLYDVIWEKYSDSRADLMHSIFHQEKFIDISNENKNNGLNEITYSGIASLSRYTIDIKNKVVKNETCMKNETIRKILMDQIDEFENPIIATYSLISLHLFGRRVFKKGFRKYMIHIKKSEFSIDEEQTVFTDDSYNNINLTVILDYYIGQGEISILKDYLYLVDNNIIPGKLGKQWGYQLLMHTLYQHYQDIQKIGEILIPFTELHQAFLYNFKTDYWHVNKTMMDRILPSSVGAEPINYDLSS